MCVVFRVLRAAQTEGSSNPLSPRGVGARTDSPQSARGKPAPMLKGSSAQSTPDLLTHAYGRDAPSPRSPLASSSMKKPAVASPPPPLDEDDLAPAEDDDEDMIQLKRKLAERTTPTPEFMHFRL